MTVKGKKQSDESRLKTSAAKKGELKMSAAKKGKRMSDESELKISADKKGKRNPCFGMATARPRPRDVTSKAMKTPDQSARMRLYKKTRNKFTRYKIGDQLRIGEACLAIAEECYGAANPVIAVRVDEGEMWLLGTSREGEMYAQIYLRVTEPDHARCSADETSSPRWNAECDLGTKSGDLHLDGYDFQTEAAPCALHFLAEAPTEFLKFENQNCCDRGRIIRIFDWQKQHMRELLPLKPSRLWSGLRQLCDDATFWSGLCGNHPAMAEEC